MSDGRSSRAAAFIMDFNDGGDKNCEYCELDFVRRFNGFIRADSGAC